MLFMWVAQISDGKHPKGLNLVYSHLPLWLKFKTSHNGGTFWVTHLQLKSSCSSNTLIMAPCREMGLLQEQCMYLEFPFNFYHRSHPPHLPTTSFPHAIPTQRQQTKPLSIHRNCMTRVHPAELSGRAQGAGCMSQVSEQEAHRGSAEGHGDALGWISISPSL